MSQAALERLGLILLALEQLTWPTTEAMVQAIKAEAAYLRAALGLDD